MSQSYQSAVKTAPPVPVWEPAAGVSLEPLPPRSRFWLWIQLWFQWVYLVVLVLALLVLAFFTEGEFGIGAAFMTASEFRMLTPRQYRVEARRNPVTWREHARRALTKEGDDAVRRERKERERALAKAAAKPDSRAARKPRVPAQPRIGLPVTAYRGLGLAGLAELAGGTGWAIDWRHSSKPLRRITLVYIREL